MTCHQQHPWLRGLGQATLLCVLHEPLRQLVMAFLLAHGRSEPEFVLRAGPMGGFALVSTSPGASLHSPPRALPLRLFTVLLAFP